LDVLAIDVAMFTVNTDPINTRTSNGSRVIRPR
jgi:hypothetical protein